MQRNFLSPPNFQPQKIHAELQCNLLLIIIYLIDYITYGGWIREINSIVVKIYDKEAPIA